jgi:hypothetical protein
MFLAVVLTLASYFRLSSASQALRTSVMNSVAGQWHKKFAIHVGWPTMALVRNGSRLFHMPPEPRAALDAVHAAEVGIYNLEGQAGLPDYSSVVRATDKAMAGRGWVRIVGVAQNAEFVAVYIPKKGISLKKMGCCVVVLQDRQLVIASARGNLEPLLAIANGRLKIGSPDHKIFAIR